MQLPNLNDTFERRYELIQVLGEGAFARVFKAHDMRTDRFVALKILKPQNRGYRDLTSARFLREAKVVAGLQSPHTITLYDFGETKSGLLYMACEFIDGRDLHLALMEERRFDGQLVAHILDQLLQSLLEAHHHSIFHRDIKPANILLREYGGDRYRATLVDFGLAKSVVDASSNLTQEGKTAGTPRYMPPEQVFGEELGPQSDIYSLGLVAYEMWTGESAIQGSNANELLLQQINGPPIRLPEELQPAALRAIIERMCAKEIGDRYANAADVLHDLRNMGRELRSSSPNPSRAPKPVAASVAPPRAAEHTYRENRGTGRHALIAGIVIGVVVAAVAVMVLSRDETPDVEVAPQLPTALNTVRDAPTSPAAEPTPESPAQPAAAEPAAAEPATVNRCRNVLAEGLQTHPVVDPGSAPFGIGEVEYSDVMTYLPAGLDATKARAIIVLFAMSSSWEHEAYIRYTGFDKIADAESLLIVSLPPKSGYKPRTWGDHSTFVAWETFLRLQQNHCLEEIPVGVLGDKLGAQAIDLLLCSPVTFQAAVTSGHRYKESHAFPALRRGVRPCEPVTYVPYLHIAHAKDDELPLEGGRGCDGDDFHHSLALDRDRWKRWNRCDPEPISTARYPDGTCETWACEAPYTTCLVQGGSNWHALPQPPGCNSPLSKFPHAEVAWAFFEEHLGLRDGTSTKTNK